MNLNEGQVYQILKYLGVKLESTPNSDGWIKIRCIINDSHIDNNPSASVNINNGVVSCFRCGKSHLNKILKEKYGIVKFSDLKDFININITPIDVGVVPNKPKPKPKQKEFAFNGVLTDLDPEKYHYTQTRGFTKEFVEKYNIKLSISNPYMDYIIIPIVDSKKGINLFEPRRLKYKEYLEKFFSSKGDISFEVLEKDWLDLKAHYGLELDAYKDNVISKKDMQISRLNTYIVRYLLLPKVWYPGNTEINKTIFNIDNLDYNKTLYLCEGFASTPKIMKVFGENVSCTFGAKLTEEQIEYLDKFVEICIVPDDDEAGLAMVEFIHERIREPKVKILPMDIEDTDPNFEKVLKDTKPILSNKYILNKKIKQIQ